MKIKTRLMRFNDLSQCKPVRIGVHAVGATSVGAVVCIAHLELGNVNASIIPMAEALRLGCRFSLEEQCEISRWTASVVDAGDDALNVDGGVSVSLTFSFAQCLSRQLNVKFYVADLERSKKYLAASPDSRGVLESLRISGYDYLKFAAMDFDSWHIYLMLF